MRLIGWIDHKRAGEVGIESGDAEGRRIVAEVKEHFVGGALQGFAADDGTDGENFFLVSAKLIADLRHGENRTDANQGIAGANEDAVCCMNGFEDAGGGMRGFHACEADATDDGFGAALH